MFLFAREKHLGAQGKNREPGLQENSVRNFTGRRGPVLALLKTPLMAGFFNDKKIPGGRPGIWVK